MADIDFGQLSEALNDKSDRDLRNVDTTAKADAVIDYQEPTSANNYTWYRKYASGWVEQGGMTTFSASTGGEATITFPIEMADTNYSCSLTSRANGSLAWFTEKNTRTTTSTVITWNYYEGRATIIGYSWQVSGMAA